MHYIIYIDVYFFVNFFMNTLLLKLLCRSEGRKGRRIPFAAFVGGILSSFFMVIGQQNPFLIGMAWIHGLIGWVMVRIVFDCKGMRRQLRLVLRLFLLEILVGGILNWFLLNKNGSIRSDEKTVVGLMPMVATAIAAVLFLWEVMKEYRREKQIRSHLYPVKLCHEEKEVDVIALLDTGNHLREPVTGKPVVVVEKCVADKLLGESEVAGMMMVLSSTSLGAISMEPVKLIPFHSLGNRHGMMPGRIIEKMVINKEQEEEIFEKVLIGIMGEELSGDGTYQMILHEAYGK